MGMHDTTGRNKHKKKGRGYPRLIHIIPLFALLNIYSIYFFIHQARTSAEQHTNKRDVSATIPSQGNSPSKNSATGSAFKNARIRMFDPGSRVFTHDDNHSPKAEGDDVANHSTAPTNVTSMSNHDCRRWGVVTTIYNPTEAIVRVARSTSWCLVIVADTKTPRDYTDQLQALLQPVAPNAIEKKNSTMIVGEGVKNLPPNVIYLSVEDQNKIAFGSQAVSKFVQSTPWKHFARKNIGYLFAIQHGAQFIFDFDDDNYIKLDEITGNPMDILPVVAKEQEYTSSNDKLMEAMILKDVRVIMQGPNAFNHHPIMNASIDNSWARGFPTDLIMEKATRGIVAYQTDLPFSGTSVGLTRSEIGVLQYLADGNPDVDALHRMTKGPSMTFPLDGKSSPVLVPSHSYAPYNAQATIHTRNAMFATLLPATVPGRVSDIWRGYFAQCLFADIGLSLVFAPPKIEQERNDHNYLEDFDAEIDLYGKSGALIDFLSNWDSDHDYIPSRMEQLWIDLYEYGYIEEEDVTYVQLWLQALNEIKYEFPVLKQKKYRNVVVMGQFNYADSKDAVEAGIFWYQKQRGTFKEVLLAGPFSDEQVSEFHHHSIKVIQGRDDKGFVSPYENHAKALLQYKENKNIDGVIYVHDDGVMNITEITQGKNTFANDEIIGSGGHDYAYMNIRDAPDTVSDAISIDYESTGYNITRYSSTYRVFPDGHFEDFNNTKTFDDHNALLKSGILAKWEWYYFERDGVLAPQRKLAMDPEMTPYLEADGSILYTPFTQADFLYVPTKYANEFEKAASLHAKYDVFLEAAYSKIVDMIVQHTDATTRNIKLCTSWSLQRGGDKMINNCKSRGNYGFIHPWKIFSHGYKHWSESYDWMRESKSNEAMKQRSNETRSDVEDGHSEDIHEARDEALMQAPLFQKDGSIRTDILFMVMGEAKLFKRWYDVFAYDVKGAKITFLYASFDKNILDVEGEKASSVFCNHHGDKLHNNTVYGDNDDNSESDWCHSIFIPGTTWTEGRNLLAEEALRMERKNGRQFTHWTFSDDDVHLYCGKMGENNTSLSWLKENGSRKELYGIDTDDNTSCWQHVFDFIGSGKVAQKASNIYLASYRTQDAQGFSAVSNADAVFVTFRREYVPYLLPYPTVPQGQSQWLSQGGIFCVICTCMPSSSVTVPYVAINMEEGEHRDYVRGFPMDVMKQMNYDNYANEEMNFNICSDFTNELFYRQGKDLIVADTIEELNEKMPEIDLHKCAPLKNRFEAWEARITGESIDLKI